jgi:murein DD-endopeptidase MepM/ murein hydrolase activator NlpD
MKRSFYSLALGVFFVNFLTGAWFGYHTQKKNAAQAKPAGAVVSAAGASAGGEARALQERSRRIDSGESLFQALAAMGVPHATIMEWMELSRPIYDPSVVKPGQKITLSYGPDNQLVKFELDISRAGSGKLVITKDGAGFDADVVKVGQGGETLPEPAGRADEAPAVADKRRFYEGTVETNLYHAGIDAGMDSDLIMALPRIYNISANFSGILKKGDHFEVLTETLPSGDEKILAAKLQRGRTAYNAYYFESGGEPGYFDEKGKAWEGFQLLKPVRKARISSTYTHRRFHPILQRYRPHLAVDYAAQSGTPVKAAATGVVTYAGSKGGYGNYIEIRHNPSYSTTYGHMQRFAKGIKKGARVKQGQVIGYVGSTGLATGPHLDYRVIKNGGSINPLRFKGERLRRVNSPDRFDTTRLALEIEMESWEQAMDIPNEMIMLSANLPARD